MTVSASWHFAPADHAWLLVESVAPLLPPPKPGRVWNCAETSSFEAEARTGRHAAAGLDIANLKSFAQNLQERHRLRASNAQRRRERLPFACRVLLRQAVQTPEGPLKQDTRRKAWQLARPKWREGRLRIEREHCDAGRALAKRSSWKHVMGIKKRACRAENAIADGPA